MNDEVDTDEPPRFITRLIALDEAIDACLTARLDAIDRRAPLPHDTIAEINRLLALCRRPLARAPADLVTPPFAAETPPTPGEAFIALLKLRVAIGHLLDAEAGPLAVHPPTG